MAEVWVVLLDPSLLTNMERIRSVDQKVDGHANRQVGPESGIKGQEKQFGCLTHPHCGDSDAIQDRLAIFVLANLEVGCVSGRFDEIAFVIDLEQAWWLAGDLAAKNKRSAEGALVGGLRGADLIVALASQLRTNNSCGPKHGRCSHEGHLAVFSVPDVFIQATDHGLGDGKIACRQKNDNPVSFGLPDIGFREHGDIVDSGTCSRVGGKNDPTIKF